MTTNATAQETMITNKGDILTVYDVEIGGTSIFYKFNATDNASLKISKSEVVMIKYKNGEVVRMDDATPHPSAVKAQPTPSDAFTLAFDINPDIETDNKKLIDEINNFDVVYKGDDTNKQSLCLFYLLGVDEGSIIETPELKVSFKPQSQKKVGKNNYEYVDIDQYPYYKNFLAVTVTNKSDKMLYLDLANCFIVKNGIAEPYYVPSSTSSSSNSLSGADVNFGAIAGTVGIGGALGTLAGGVSVGGGSSNSSTTVTYSQRVISVPPMASVNMGVKDIELENIVKLYLNQLIECGVYAEHKKYYVVNYKGIKRGQKINIPQVEGIKPLGIMVTYSLDENLSATNTMRIGLHLRQAIGGVVGGFIISYEPFLRNIEYTQYHPLIFRDFDAYLAK